MDSSVAFENTAGNKCSQKTSNRKRSLGDQTRHICPVCTITVRGSKMLKLHVKQEITKFDKFSNHLRSKRKICKAKLKNEEETSENNCFLSIDERKKQFQNIKRRRYERCANTYLSSMKKKSKNTESSLENTASTYDIISCAVCEDFLDTSEGSAIKHLRKCFAKKEYEYDLFSSSDEEDAEEISWAGQTWIRSSSEIISNEGNLTRIGTEDINDELVVDVEDDESLGQQQFFEANIIPCAPSDLSPNETNMVRDALVTYEKEQNGDKHCSESIDSNKIDTDLKDPSDLNMLVVSLKSKISEMEDRLNSDYGKCPICMNLYVDPVVSTSCWHVCCSECWLRTLGAKKLCPKCYNIVSPSHLRKIYL